MLFSEISTFRLLFTFLLFTILLLFYICPVSSSLICSEAFIVIIIVLWFVHFTFFTVSTSLIFYARKLLLLLPMTIWLASTPGSAELFALHCLCASTSWILLVQPKVPCLLFELFFELPTYLSFVCVLIWCHFLCIVSWLIVITPKIYIPGMPNSAVPFPGTTKFLHTIFLSLWVIVR